MILHIFSCYTPTDADTLHRQKLAQESWKSQNWTEKPITDAMLPSMFLDGSQKLAYVKDVFDLGIKGEDDQTIICYTNADIFTRSDCSVQIAACLQDSLACYSFRRDFHHELSGPLKDEDYAKATPYAGSDLVAFRVIWWKTYRDDYPAMLLGREAWDPLMRLLIDWTNPGVKTHVEGVIAHQRHYSKWEDAANRYTLASQRHVLSTARTWLLKHGEIPERYGIGVV